MATGIAKRYWKNSAEFSVESVTNGSQDVFLSYQGKEAIQSVLVTPPAELLKVWPDNILSSQELPNRLYFGDNLSILASLLNDPKMRGKVRLIYIDPPFATSGVFQTRGQADAYSDLLAGSHFIEFLRKRLILLRELLAEDGSIYVHLDDNMSFHIKIIMDEVFGQKNFRNWITRKKCNPKNYTRKTYGNISDFILFYSKSDNYVWHRPVDGWTTERALKEYQYVEDGTGRRYKKVPVHAPGVRNGETGKPWKGMEPPPGKHWQYTPDKLDAMDARGEIYWSPNGNPRRKIYLEDSAGIPVQDIWLDFRDAHNQNIKITGYPTEKNKDLLARIIAASSNPGDIVLDCFCGSGSTLSTASELGRNWIGIDSSSEAIATVLNRFAYGTQPMGDFVTRKEEPPKMLSLFDSLEEIIQEKPTPNSIKQIKDFILFAEKSVAENLTTVLSDWRRAVGQADSVSSVRENETNYMPTNMLSIAASHISAVDPLMSTLISKIGACRLSAKTAGFEALAEAIIKQQLSRKAAQSIFVRILNVADSKHITPLLLKRLSDKELQECGVSARKISYLRSLEQFVSEGMLDFTELEKQSDEQVIDNLTRIKGIGRWTAEMYLIFVLLRPDVFPLDDMAIRAALCKLYGIDNDKFIEAGVKIADSWRPYRSIGCWYLWAYLNDGGK
jgi:adenine-specific DNA-methyltransferase